MLLAILTDRSVRSAILKASSVEAQALVKEEWPKTAYFVHQVEGVATQDGTLSVQEFGADTTVETEKIELAFAQAARGYRRSARINDQFLWRDDAPLLFCVSLL